MGERRYHIRVKPEADKPVRVDVNGDDFLDVLYASDISEGGIGFNSEHGFDDCAINRPVKFVVSLPHPVNHMLKVEGKITHLDGPSFGVIFTNMTREAREYLHSYVHYRLKNEPFLVRFAHSLHLN